MVKVWHLSSCSTCVRILNDLGLSASNADLQDIKTENITSRQLDELKTLCGSYEALFSHVARKYRAMGLGEQALGESDYKRLITEEYTFLKRPVILVERNGRRELFIGNAPKTIAAAKSFLG